MSIEKALALAEKTGTKMVDFKFVDMPGLWQHFSVPLNELTPDSFKDGFGFDGSSLRGWQPIHASDMLILPDPTTATIDPFMGIPTMSLICDVVDPLTREPYSRDPRNIARKAESYLKSTGLADVCYIGPEPEFFIFDNIRFDQGVNEGYYHIDSDEGHWNSGANDKPNLGYKPRAKEGYFPVAPTDSLQDLRTEMVLEMQKIGIHIECQHHEVATAGQCEIDMRFAPLLKMGDQMMWFKYIIKNVARRYHKTVTFMPKPLYGDNGSGMHTHVSLWKEGKPLFAGNGYSGLSEMALHFIGGIIKNAPALLAFTNPTTNSYRRLVPGYEAPIRLAYSSRNRSAAVRIPMYSNSPKAKRIEFRTPDPSCNGYLAFAATLMAGLDGIANKTDPGKPVDENIYKLPEAELARIAGCPASLDEALSCLKQNHEFLLRGNVFTKDLIETWIDYKMEAEVQPMRLRPVPYEFNLYYDI
ncbi:MAG: type I glutamate--ammonia ligase [Deltaproteobacteria bacterium RIFCSPLOWO2_02_FULL_44_10]|nr:MAG: type I glutamate--ammonia ligase [Deltaproteobacteria bacterium RIFCSPHIGHO2_02_FULL_44_16]OGQ45056.1 MAG: type I glutamate--ammonia ligase [Deltaproteobacteria bacterium RIFCSPLOWO2_02_FULL_44_10]